MWFTLRSGPEHTENYDFVFLLTEFLLHMGEILTFFFEIGQLQEPSN